MANVKKLTDVQRDLVSQWYPYVLRRAFEYGRDRGYIVAEKTIDRMTDALISAAKAYDPTEDRAVPWFQYMSFCLRNSIFRMHSRSLRGIIHYENTDKLNDIAVTAANQYEIEVLDEIEHASCKLKESRRRQIKLFCKGMSNREVANELGINATAVSETRRKLLRSLRTGKS